MSSSCIGAMKRRWLSRSSAHTTAGSAAGPSIVRAAHGNEAPDTPRASSEPQGKNVFQEINKHLLIVFDAAAALVDVGTRSKASVTGVVPPRANQVTIPNRNQFWAS